jgi:hypothetical protein
MRKILALTILALTLAAGVASIASNVQAKPGNSCESEIHEDAC